MLLLKAFHIIFMVTWFAGLFYLPRLFVYHAQTTDTPSLDRFLVMERRLFGIMTIGAVLTAVFGVALLIGFGGLEAPHWRMGWWHAKVAALMLLVAYHVACYLVMRRFRAGANTRSHVWYRWFNEVPSVLLIVIVVLVVVRPF